MGTFLGHPVERTDASKFQIFEIQVFVFNYRRISTRGMFENPGFLRFKDILKTPVFLSSSFSSDVIILPYLEIWIQVNKHFEI